MSSYTTFLDLVQAALDRAGESPTDTTGDYYAAAQREVVAAVHKLGNAHPFLWLRTTGALVTTAPYTTGTVQVTNGSATATLSGAPAAGLGSFTGRKLVVDGHPDFYRIAAHTAGNAALTLDVAYQGDDAATASYTLYRDEYTLATDCRHLIWLGVAQTGEEIVGKSEEWLREHYPEPATGAWPPGYFARIGESVIRFSQYPSQARRLEYAYTKMTPDISDANTTNPVPLNHRHVIAEGALAVLHHMKRDTRRVESEARFMQGIAGVMEDDDRKRLPLRGHRHLEPDLYDG